MGEIDRPQQHGEEPKCRSKAEHHPADRTPALKRLGTARSHKAGGKGKDAKQAERTIPPPD
ncbi:MAG: hypothetical protein R3Y06_10805 [Faecalibacterium sp.]